MIRPAVIGAALAIWGVAHPAWVAAQQPHLVVIAGLGGDPEHGDVFHGWAVSLVEAAKARYGVPEPNIVFLAEQPDRDPARIGGRATRENVEKTFVELAARAGPADQVFVVLIGHGSFDGRESRFNLPGPDLTATDYAKLLDRLQPRRVVFVNTASASGGFVEALAGPDRTIVTATRSGAERYATLFGGFFVEALTSDEADVDKDRRVSVLEAFEYARRKVTDAYEREGLLQTEHALLDDDGDGRGSGEPGVDAKDGRVAALLYLGAGAPAGAPAPEALPADPALRALYAERQALEQRVGALKLLKASMDSKRYQAELEKLLVDLALKSRAIRELERKEPE